MSTPLMKAITDNPELIQKMNPYNFFIAYLKTTELCNIYIFDAIHQFDEHAKWFKLFDRTWGQTFKVHVPANYNTLQTNEKYIKPE